MLISTLKDGLKENFSDKVKNAWLKIFDVVQVQMKVGMKQAAQVMSTHLNETNHSPSPNDNNNLNQENKIGNSIDNTTNAINGKLLNDLEEINLQTAS